MFLKRHFYNFGEHFTLDGYRGDYKKLDNRENVLKCLDELPEKIGMNKLSEPQVFYAPANDVKDPGGWSGYVIVAESHISIHTFPRRGFVSIDVYTCKNGLNRKFLSDYFIQKFRLKNIETHFIRRGMRYPASDIY